MGDLLSQRIKEILADVLNVSAQQINQDSSPDTIETWDSMHHMNMVIALEQEFCIQFSPEEIEQLLNVEHLVKLVRDKLSNEGSANAAMPAVES